MMNSQKAESDSQKPVKGKNSGLHRLLDETTTSTYEDVKSIIDAKIELVKIELTEKISMVGAAVVLGVIMVIGAGYFVTTVALLTGELLGHPFLGYLLVSFIFVASFLFFTKFRPLLLKNLIQKILLSLHDYNK